MSNSETSWHKQSGSPAVKQRQWLQVFAPVRICKASRPGSCAINKRALVEEARRECADGRCHAVLLGQHDHRHASLHAASTLSDSQAVSLYRLSLSLNLPSSASPPSTPPWAPYQCYVTTS